VRPFPLGLALLSLGATAFAQPPQDKPKPQDKKQEIPTFGVSTELVYVRFHVEKKGGYVGALTKEQIRVLEDGQPRTIALLETPAQRERTIPPEITLMLDVSSSVLDAGLLDEQLVKQVFFASLSEQAKVALCAFGGELKCLTGPTREVEVLLDGFEEALNFGREQRHEGTRLYASVTDAISEASTVERAQRVIVIFSDGLDNRGGSVGEAIKAAAEHDVRVYAVKVSRAFQATAPNIRGGFGAPNRAMYDYKKFDLDKLAAESGGRAYEPGTLDKKALATILKSIATEITMENVVGYQPEGAPTGKKRHVKVELVDKTLGSIKDGEKTIVR
jgi:VWFA-related protein